MATLAGTSNFNGANGNHFFCSLYYDIAQDIENNRSTITLYEYVGSNDGWSANGSNSPCAINEEILNYISVISARSNVLVATKVMPVKHNPDGTFPATAISCSCVTNWTGVGGAYVNATLTSANIPTIPRASSVGCSDFYIESSTNIVINSASSNFKHTLKYAFGNLVGTIVEKTAQTVYAWTPNASDFYKQILNNQQGVGTITCETYNNNTLIGTKTCNFTARVDPSKNKPDVSLAVIDTNTITKALTGNENTLVKYFSNAKATITASAKNHATIKSYFINNVTSEQVSTINNVETNEFTAKAIDSRNIDNISDKVTKNFIDYVKLAIKSIDIDRTGPTTDQIRLDLEGLYFNNTFGTVDNELTLQMRYKEQYGEWSNYCNITANITDENTFNLSNYNLNTLFNANFDYQKAYTFEIVINDKLMTVNQEVNLKRGLPVVAYGEDFVHLYGDLELKSGNIVLDYKVVDRWQKGE